MRTFAPIARAARRLVRLALTIVVLAALASLAAPSPGAARCTPPEVPALLDLPETRIEVQRYRAAAQDYFACAGTEADPSVQAAYDRLIEGWGRLVYRWGNRHRP